MRVYFGMGGFRGSGCFIGFVWCSLGIGVGFWGDDGSSKKPLSIFVMGL